MKARILKLLFYNHIKEKVSIKINHQLCFLSEQKVHKKCYDDFVIQAMEQSSDTSITKKQYWQ
jgi:hypothetical protein